MIYNTYPSVPPYKRLFSFFFSNNICNLCGMKLSGKTAFDSLSPDFLFKRNFISFLVKIGFDIRGLVTGQTSTWFPRFKQVISWVRLKFQN